MTIVFNVLFVTELQDFKVRRIAHFKKNMVDLAELEIKHAKVNHVSQFNIIKYFLKTNKNTD